MSTGIQLCTTVDAVRFLLCSRVSTPGEGACIACSSSRGPGRPPHPQWCGRAAACAPQTAPRGVTSSGRACEKWIKGLYQVYLYMKVVSEKI